MSAPEDLLWWQLEEADLPMPMREYRFCKERRWRSDFAWPEKMLLVECEGGSWTGGRHVRGVGFEADCFKYNSAVLGGWRLLRFTTEMILEGAALNMIREALDDRKPDE